MDPGLFSLHTCVKLVLVVVYLLGSARCSQTGPSCLCSDIPPWPLTQPPTQGCTQTSNTFRYKCIDGYVRKAGTSNLIRCESTGKWSEPTLSCIMSTSSPLTPTTTEFVSSRSTETDYKGLTSAVIHLVQTSGPPLENTTLPQPSTDTPSPSSPVSTSSPVTLGRVRSTSTRSPPTTTHGTLSLTETSRSERTTSPSSLSSSGNSTSSTFVGTDTLATKVIVPVLLGIIVLAFGAGWFLYRRRSRNNTPRNHMQGQIAEEKILMHPTNENSIQNNDTTCPLKDS